LDGNNGNGGRSAALFLGDQPFVKFDVPSD
jgi:hypothetical protein